MNALQVMEEVVSLCSLGKLTSERVFYASLNRALGEIGQYAPKKTWETVYHALPMPFFALSNTVTVTPRSPYRVSADSIHAYSISAYGEGTVTVTVNGERVREVSLTKGGVISLAKTVKEDFSKESGEVTVSFGTKSKLFVTALALYGTPCEQSVVYSPYYRYPVSKFTHRFLSFTGDTMRYGRKFDNADATLRFSDDAVEIVFEKDGIYEVGYFALPDTVTHETREEELYVREDAKCLVPLLTAYYYALEDGNEMADAFLARYCDARSRIAREQNESVSDVYGW